MTLSRRTILFGGVAGTVMRRSKVVPASPLLLAGSRFDILKERLDSNRGIDDEFWSEFRSVTDHLVELRATSSEEYFAKAKAAAWARLGDLDPPGTETLDTRIALAVLRDIILQNEPYLYDGGALTRMYADLEEGDNAGCSTGR